MKCPNCQVEIEVSVEEAARVLGKEGGKVKGRAKGRVLSRQESLAMLKRKYEKKRQRLYPGL